MLTFRYLFLPWLLAVAWALVLVPLSILIVFWANWSGAIAGAAAGAITGNLAIVLGWGTVWLLAYRKE